MRVWALTYPLSASLGLAAVGASLPYDYGFDVAGAVRRQVESPTPFVAKGLRGVNGSLPLRLEIGQLQQQQEKWTLYLLGLSMMQYTDQSQLLSYYQIAGPRPLSRSGEAPRRG